MRHNGAGDPPARAAGAGARLDLDLVGRLETHAVRAWPATIERRAPGGWVLRATPGLRRGRSNHALTPCRELTGSELEPALVRVARFADEQSIGAGIQVSPTFLHRRLERELDRRGWAAHPPVLVLVRGAGIPERAQPPNALVLETASHASPEWLATWGRCEPGRDLAAHAATVFARLRGRAVFARLGEVAVGIAVASEGLVGLFCLAVDPAHRRTGLGTALVERLLARWPGYLAYLQVEAANTAALSVYDRLGFGALYRYRHRTVS